MVWLSMLHLSHGGRVSILLLHSSYKVRGLAINTEFSHGMRVSILTLHSSNGGCCFDFNGAFFTWSACIDFNVSFFRRSVWFGFQCCILRTECVYRFKCCILLIKCVVLLSMVHSSLGVCYV